MPTPHERLHEVAGSLAKGVTPVEISVRELISWFGAARRGANVVREIRRALEQVKLETVPDFENNWVDGPIRFVQAGSDDQRVNVSTTYRIGALQSANRKPVSVKPESSLSEATTIMLANDFSQLPVMTTDREVKGTVSWKSIGVRMALGSQCSLVRECMDKAQIVGADASLFEAIGLIASNDYVLVQAEDRKICGIVTASDLSQQFRELAEPFLLIGEIEGLLRRLIHGKFSVDELAQARDPNDSGRPVAGVSDLTFGEYIRLLEEESRWSKLKITVDRREFISWCNRVREIRNDVMHFDPEGIDPEALSALRKFARLLQELKRLGVV